MAKTTAERQAEYRARRDMAREGDGDRRVNTWVSTAAYLALGRIAGRYGVTRREILERLVLAEDERLLADMKMDTPEWDAYFSGRTVRQ